MTPKFSLSGTKLPPERRIGIGPHTALVRGRDGLFLVNVHDVYIGQALCVYGEFSRLEADFLRKLLRPGDVVIEVGANIGAHTVGLARHLGAKGQIYAIEPQPAVFHLLAANMALNEIENVRCLPIACGAAAGTLVVPPVDYGRTGNFGGVALAESGKGVRVAVQRLDQTIDTRALRLIKIDVEGMEGAVLEGARGLIVRHRPLLYVENDRAAKSKALIELLWSLDYKLEWHAPPLFAPDNFFAEANNVYGNTASLNMLGVPKELTETFPGMGAIADSSFHPAAKT